MTNESLDDRLDLDGAVDFTMMYAAHDAFTRDLHAFVDAGPARDWGPDELTAWGIFTTQLHIHHQAEDAALWPPLREKDLASSEVSTLDEMEMEHAQIDPYLEEVDAAIASSDPVARDQSLRLLADGLARHMRHEENAALPLITAYLGVEGWQRFTSTFRESQGIRGAATYFPWLLEGAPADTRKKVLAVLPAPARLLYRLRWEPRYHRART